MTNEATTPTTDKGPSAHRTVVVCKSLLAKNDGQAERNRAMFRRRGTSVVNLLSSPGSGKTELLRRTLGEFGLRRSLAVFVGDLQTENDAERLEGFGHPVVAITTGGMCHLEAEMVSMASREFDLSSAEMLFVENVGNLVCPASFDLGEDLRVVLLSTTEGEDKPLKYPKIFRTADVVIVTKTDLAEAVEFDRPATMANVRAVNPEARILELSARTGEGMKAWYALLEDEISRSSAAVRPPEAEVGDGTRPE